MIKAKNAGAVHTVQFIEGKENNILNVYKL